MFSRIVSNHKYNECSIPYIQYHMPARFDQWMTVGNFNPKLLCLNPVGDGPTEMQ